MRSMQSDLALRLEAYLLSPLLFAAGTRQVLADAARLQPDVLHAHWVLPNGLPAALVYGPMANRLCQPAPKWMARHFPSFPPAKSRAPAISPAAEFPVGRPLPEDGPRDTLRAPCYAAQTILAGMTRELHRQPASVPGSGAY